MEGGVSALRWPRKRRNSACRLRRQRGPATSPVRVSKWRTRMRRTAAGEIGATTPSLRNWRASSLLSRWLTGRPTCSGRMQASQTARDATSGAVCPRPTRPWTILQAGEPVDVVAVESVTRRAARDAYRRGNAPQGHPCSRYPDDAGLGAPGRRSRWRCAAIVRAQCVPPRSVPAGRSGGGAVRGTVRRGMPVTAAHSRLARVFHGRRRSNATHASTTDPDARLMRSGDKAYDPRDFVAACRERETTPHVAQSTSGRRSAVDGRTT